MLFQLPAISFLLALSFGSITVLGRSDARHPVSRHRAIRNRAASHVNQSPRRRQVGSKSQYCTAKAAGNAEKANVTITTALSGATTTTTTTTSTPSATDAPKEAPQTAAKEAQAVSTTTTTTTAATTPTPASTLPTGAEWTKSYTDGDVTYYGIGLGACGWTNYEPELIVAVAHELFDSFATGDSVDNPNLNPICGHYVLATLPGYGSVRAKVVDRCGGCDGCSLDFSIAAFELITNNNPANNASIDHGRFTGMNWHFVS